MQVGKPTAGHSAWDQTLSPGFRKLSGGANHQKNKATMTFLFAQVDLNSLSLTPTMPRPLPPCQEKFGTFGVKPRPLRQGKKKKKRSQALISTW